MLFLRKNFREFPFIKNDDDDVFFIIETNFLNKVKFIFFIDFFERKREKKNTTPKPNYIVLARRLLDVQLNKINKT